MLNSMVKKKNTLKKSRIEEIIRKKNLETNVLNGKSERAKVTKRKYII